MIQKPKESLVVLHYATKRTTYIKTKQTPTHCEITRTFVPKGKRACSFKEFVRCNKDERSAILEHMKTELDKD